MAASSGNVAGSLTVELVMQVAQLAADMQRVKQVMSDGAASINTSMDGVGRASGQATIAGQRMIANLTEQVKTFGYTKEQMLMYKAGLNGVESQVASLNNELKYLQERAAANGSALTGATDGLNRHGAAANDAGKKVHQFGFQTAQAKTELIVLAHELSQGNYSRFGGSMMVLAERTGAASFLFSGLALSVAAVALPLALFAVGAVKGAIQMDVLNRSLKETGGMAGMTADGFERMAHSMGDSFGMRYGKAHEALQELVSDGRMTGQTIEAVGRAAVSMADLTGMSAAEAAQALSKMADGVAAWAAKSNERYHFLSLAQYEHIQLLEKQGRAQEAMQETAGLVDAAMRKNGETLGYIAGRLKYAGEQWAWFWDKAVSADKPLSIDAQLERLAGQAARSIDPTKINEEIAQIREARSRDELRAQEKQITALTQAEGIKARTVADGYDQRFLTASQKLKRETTLYLDSQRDIAAAGGKVDDAAKKQRILDGIAEANKEKAGPKAKTDPYIALNKAIQERLQTQQMELAGDLKLTEGEKLAAKFTADLADGTLKLTAAQKAQYTQNLQRLIENDKAIEQRKAMEKANLAAAESQMKYVASLDSELGKLQDQVQAQKDQNDRIGLNTQQIADLDAQKLIDQATTLDLMAIKNLDRNGDELQYDITKKQAQAYRDLIVARDVGRFKQTAVDDAKATSDAWIKSADEIDKAISGAFMNGFTGAKSFLQNFISSLKGLFSKIVLQPILQPVSGALASFMNPGSPQALAANGASGLSGFSSLSSLGSLGTTFTTLGSVFASSASAGFGALMSGQVGTAIAGGIEAIAGATSASIASGVGLLAGSLGPIALGIYGAYKVFTAAFGMGDKKMVDSGVKGSIDGSGSTSGQAYQDFFQKGGWFRSDRNSQDTQALDPAVANAMTQGFAAIKASQAASLNALGLDGSRASSATASFDVRLKTDGTQAENDAANQKAFAESVQSISDTLAANLVPAVSRFKQGAETASATLQRLGQEFTATNLIAQMLGKSVEQVFGGMSDESIKARESIISLTGGLQALQTKLGSYYQNYYSQAERDNEVRSDVVKSLQAVGLQMPATRDQFRAMVQAQNLMTEPGQKAYAALLNVADAFASIVPAAASASAAVQGLTLSQAAQNVTSAQGALTTAYNTASAAIKTTQANMQAFADGTKAFAASLIQSTASPLNANDKYQAALQSYRATASLAIKGDAKGQADFQNAANNMLAASRVINASGAQYSADFAKVQADAVLATAAAQAQVTIGQQQLRALDQSVQWLIQVNTGVLSVRDAIGQLQIALEAQRRLSTPGQTLMNGNGKTNLNLDIFGNMLLGADAVNGSHAAGDESVPFDGYKAELHQGERVLTARQNVNLNSLANLDMQPVVQELRDLRTEVASLRADAAQQAAAGMMHQAVTLDGAADKIVAGAHDAAQRQAWASRTGMKELA